MAELLSDSGRFQAIPYFDEAINNAIFQSEIDGGVSLNDLAIGTVLEVTTRHHTYTLVNQGEGRVLMSGHPKYCPEPVTVRFHGSTWGTPMIRNRYIGREMRMEFWHPEFGMVLTSFVLEIRELPRNLDSKPATILC